MSQRPRFSLILPPGLVLVGLALGGVAAAPAGAQDDVTQLGLRHGTRPPEAYFELRRTDPTAFRFSRAWKDRNPRLVVERADVTRPLVRLREAGVELPLGRSSTGPAPVLGPRDGAVVGTFTFPVILGYFADDPARPRFDRGVVQRHFFDGPNDDAGTIRDFYAEVSGGAIDLRGEAQPWVRSTLDRPEVTGGSSGLGGSSQVGAFIVSVLNGLDAGSVDWGRYDNDGPDGIPNSGDDDGFVDVLAVLHPTSGAECNGAPDRIWSHRWTLWSAAGQPYTTGTRSANGELIRINDYTIQPVLDCAGEDLNQIGVVAHELGHGFGLPDLYCTGTGCGTAGIGNWGLMGSGSWGCDGRDPALPCHLSAWSKTVMGWAAVEDLQPGLGPSEIVLEPVLSSGRVLRYDIPGTSEYYLLENRQALGFDRNLHQPGLLVWHVDQARVDAAWAVNRVNGDPSRYGVSVIQADNEYGLHDVSGNRGDGGDPFPGTSQRTEFHAGSAPAALSHDGRASGLTLLDLRSAGTDLAFQVATRFQSVTLGTSGDSGSRSLLSVDGIDLGVGGSDVPAAPFQPLQVRAAPGEPLEEGTRRPFTGWEDGDSLPDRTVWVAFRDTALTAVYEGRELQVDVALEGGRFDVEPGTIDSDPVSPGLWFPQGTAVTLTARPTTGFSFRGWTGGLEGAPNPVGLVVDAPMSAGAAFDFDFAVPEPDTVVIAAGDQLTVSLRVENATAPVQWFIEEGQLPAGVRVLSLGMVVGAPAELGTFTFTLGARDALGLEATAPVTLRIEVPEIPLALLAGRLLESGVEPSAGQILYLDLAGNGNGRLDTGDIRAHLRRAVQGTVPPASGVVEHRLTLVPTPPGGSP